MRCDAFLASARRIFHEAGEAPDECAGRTIVHAAYYAVFHLVAEKFSLNVAGADPARHSDLARRLGAYTGSDQTLLEARLHFRPLQRARVNADYHLDQVITLEKVRTALSRADAVYKAAGIEPRTM